MSRRIAVVEPQMDGIFHASFNAALLHTVALAYPDASISFRAFPEHLHIVRGILEPYAPEQVQRIEWRATPPPPSASLLARWRHSGRALREILSAHEPVVFCSISRMQLLQLKRIMRPGDVVPPCCMAIWTVSSSLPSTSFP